MNELKVRSEGRQSILVGCAQFTYKDLGTTNFKEALQLPSDAIILRGYLAITSPFDTGTFDVGTEVTPNKYLSAISSATVAITPLTGITGKTVGEVEKVGLTPSVAMTQGEGSLVLEYIRPTRAFVTEG